MANFRTLEVQVSDESSFSEAVRTYAVRLPVLDCKPNLVEERFDDASYQARQNHGQGGFRGPRRADLDLSMVLGGHGTTCAGALSETALQQLLGDGLGGNNVAAQGTTVKTAGTAASFTLNAVTGLAVGQIIRVGVAGDGRGGGQPGVFIGGVSERRVSDADDRAADGRSVGQYAQCEMGEGDPGARGVGETVVGAGDPPLHGRSDDQQTYR